MDSSLGSIDGHYSDYSSISDDSGYGDSEADIAPISYSNIYGDDDYFSSIDGLEPKEAYFLENFGQEQWIPAATGIVALVSVLAYFFVLRKKCEISPFGP